jgi:hypothetical protein
MGWLLCPAKKAANLTQKRRRFQKLSCQRLGQAQIRGLEQIFGQ